jgi:hypothetical protein
MDTIRQFSASAVSAFDQVRGNESQAREFRLNENQVAELYGAKKPLRQESDYKVIAKILGSHDVGYDISEQLKALGARDKKIGFIICANNGLPGGNAGKAGFVATKDNFKTQPGQEESSLSNALYGTCGSNIDEQQKIIDGIRTAWGMKNLEGTDLETIQGIDFVHAQGADTFNRCYPLPRELTLCGLDADYNLDETKKYNAVFVFADSVNCAESRSYLKSIEENKNDSSKPIDETGTQHRTRNLEAVNNPGAFREDVKAKMRSAIDAGAALDVTHLLLGRLSYGINAGPNKDYIAQEYPKIVQEILNEVVGSKGETRGQFFDEIIDTEFKPAPKK